MLFLLSSFPKLVPSLPAKYMMEHCLSGHATPPAVEGLVYKKLAKKTLGAIVLEPVIDYLMRSVLTADTLWIATGDWQADSLLLFKSKDIFLQLQRYPYTIDEWSVTPYPDKDALLIELDGLVFTEVVRIGHDGSRQLIHTAGHFNWIGDDGE